MAVIDWISDREKYAIKKEGMLLDFPCASTDKEVIYFKQVLYYFLEEDYCTWRPWSACGYSKTKDGIIWGQKLYEEDIEPIDKVLNEYEIAHRWIRKKDYVKIVILTDKLEEGFWPRIKYINE